jgi:HK97 gp10 family phage protein
MGVKFQLDYTNIEKLENAIKDYQGNAEEIINDVLHNEAGTLIQDAVKRLMPKSDVNKRRHAKNSDSLVNVNGNLSVTVTTKKQFQYLYFPDDGTTTRRHVGKNGRPQEFFYKGGEAVQDEIIDRCIGRLVGDFEG